MNEAAVFEQIGSEGLKAMVAAFYRRVPEDDILGPMYPSDDMTGAEERLYQFLHFRIGGDTTYTEKRGHPRLRMRHGPFQINFRARDRWMRLMDEAIAEVGIPEPAAKELHVFFAQVADFLRNTPEVDGPFKI